VPYHWGIDPDLLALDIGATKVAVRTASYERAQPWSGTGRDSDLRGLETLIRAATGAAPPAVAASGGGTWRRIGVASAPTVDGDGVVVAWPSRPSWVGLPLVALLREMTGGEVVVADDGAVAALAEAAEAAVDDIAFLGLGTGVGGGLVARGRLLCGEPGHLPVADRGPLCNCGRRGCLQSFVCGPALAARATVLRGRPTSTHDLVAAAGTNAVWAARVVGEAADALARAVVILAETTRPARVHLGGGIGTALTELPARVTSALESWRRPGHPLPSVHHALLGADASLTGAVLLAQVGQGGRGDPGR
jgi:kanosamine 6-kinase